MLHDNTKKTAKKIKKKKAKAKGKATIPAVIPPNKSPLKLSNLIIFSFIMGQISLYSLPILEVQLPSSDRQKHDVIIKSAKQG